MRLIFLEHSVQKQAPGSLIFLHQLLNGLLSFPSSSSHAQRHLFFNPWSIIRAFSPGVMNWAIFPLHAMSLSLLWELGFIRNLVEARFLKTRLISPLIG